MPAACLYCDCTREQLQGSLSRCWSAACETPDFIWLPQNIGEQARSSISPDGMFLPAAHVLESLGGSQMHASQCWRQARHTMGQGCLNQCISLQTRTNAS